MIPVFDLVRDLEDWEIMLTPIVHLDGSVSSQYFVVEEDDHFRHVDLSRNDHRRDEIPFCYCVWLCGATL